MEQVKAVDMIVPDMATRERTKPSKKPLSEHSSNSENESLNDSETVEKLIRVGIKNISLVVKSIDKEQIKQALSNIENKGSPVAPMYSLGDVKNIFKLSDSEYFRLKGMINKPKTKRLTVHEKVEKSVTYDSKVKKLESNLNKIKQIQTENQALRAEIRTLKREIGLNKKAKK